MINKHFLLKKDKKSCMCALHFFYFILLFMMKTTVGIK